MHDGHHPDPETNPISPDAGDAAEGQSTGSRRSSRSTTSSARENAVRAVPLGHRRVLRHRPDRGREEARRRRPAPGGRAREAGQRHAGHRVPQPLRVLLPDHRRRRRGTGEDGRTTRTSARCTTRFHAHIEEKDPAAAIRTVAPVLAHVHISENDRGTPGTGQVHWDETFKTLKEVGTTAG